MARRLADLRHRGARQFSRLSAIARARAPLHLLPDRRQAPLPRRRHRARFLEGFQLTSVPLSEHLANGTPSGPCNSYGNEDTWTDVPYVPGVVLIGDAAGHNDPIIGQGLWIGYRDVRIVRD